MQKFLEILAKVFLIPLLEKLGKWILSEFKAWKERKDIVKDQKKKEEAVENAKTPEEIRTSHRNNKL